VFQKEVMRCCAPT